MKRADRSDECRKINFTEEVAYGNIYLKNLFYPPLRATPRRASISLWAHQCRYSCIGQVFIRVMICYAIVNLSFRFYLRIIFVYWTPNKNLALPLRNLLMNVASFPTTMLKVIRPMRWLNPCIVSGYSFPLANLTTMLCFWNLIRSERHRYFFCFASPYNRKNIFRFLILSLPFLFLLFYFIFFYFPSFLVCLAALSEHHSIRTFISYSCLPAVRPFVLKL